jgi:hypothetical protein
MREIPETGLEDVPKTEVARQAGVLKEDVAALLRETTPDHVRATVTAEMVKFDAAYSTAPAPNTLAAMRSEHESNVRVQEDQRLRAKAADIETRHAGFMRGVSAVVTALRKAPRELNPQVDSTRELAALTRFTGRRTADLLTAYANTSDVTNPTFVALVENDLAAFRLREDLDREELEADARARMELKALIAERQRQRVPPDWQELEAESKTLLSGTVVRELLNHLRSGRGFAVIVDNPRPLRLVSKN